MNVFDRRDEMAVAAGVRSGVRESAVEGLLAGIPENTEAFQYLGAGGVEDAQVVQVALPAQPAAQRVSGCVW